MKAFFPVFLFAIVILNYQITLCTLSSRNLDNNINTINLKANSTEDSSNQNSNSPYSIFSTKIDKRRELVLAKADYYSKCVNNKSEAIGYNSTILQAYPNITAHEFLISRNHYTDKYKSQVERIIIGEEHSELRPLLTKIASPYIIFIVFAIITLIGWFIYWLVYWRELLYNTTSSNSEETNKKSELLVKCNNYSLLIMIIALVGIIISSIMAWIFTAQLGDKADELNCSNIRLVTDIADGEDNMDLPKWVGIRQLATKLTLLAGSLPVIQINSINGFSAANNTEIKNTQKDYYNLIDNLYNKYKNEKVSNPNPESIENMIDQVVTPSFIQTLGPKEKPNSVSEAIKNDYDQFIYNTVSKVEQLNKTTALLNSQVVLGVTHIKLALQKVGVFAVDINKFDEDYLKPIRDFVSLFFFSYKI